MDKWLDLMIFIIWGVYFGLFVRTKEADNFIIGFTFFYVSLLALLRFLNAML